MELTLRKFRLQSGMTLKDMAAKTGISISYISQMERGERRISLDQMRIFARVLGVPASTLMVDAETATITVDGVLRAGEVMDLDRLEHLVAPPILPPAGLSAIKVEDNSMAPCFARGGAIIYEVRGAGTPEEGAIYVAQYGRRSRRVCQVTLGSHRGEYNIIDPLMHNRPIYDVKLRALHRVVLYLPPQFCEYVGEEREEATAPVTMLDEEDERQSKAG